MTERWSIHHGDVLERLPDLEPGSFDAVLCDPPYGLKFMGKAWDHGVPGEPVWSLVREALKPGAHLLAFGGTRTEHRLVCAIEDAGFEIRDKVIYCFGSGFPKSHNFGCRCKVQCDNGESSSKCDLRPVRIPDVSQAIDPAEESREVLQQGVPKQGEPAKGFPRPEPVHEGGEQPSVEGRGHIPQASGQLQERSVCEVSGEPRVNGSVGRVCDGASAGGGSRNGACAEANGVRASHQPRSAGQSAGEPDAVRQQSGSQTVRASRRASADLERCPDCGGLIRFRGYGSALKPAYEPCVVAMKPLDGTFAANAAAHGVAGLWIDGGRVGTEQTVTRRNGDSGGNGAYGRDERVFTRINPPGRWPANLILDAEAAAMLGAPARYYYTAKASTRERNAGLEDLPSKAVQKYGSIRTNRGAGYSDESVSKNHHPTLKPIDLCRYLATLILPPKRDTPRRLLVPFSGSGSEMIGALLAGWDEVVGIEREREYIDIAERRLAHWCASSEEDATTLFAESA